MGHLRALLLCMVVAAPLRGATLITNLGVLGSDTHSGATDVNDAGVVVGTSFFLDVGNFPRHHGFRWSSGTGMQAIGSLLPNNDSYAQGVNSSGKLVGWSTTAQGNAGISHVPPGPVQQIANAGEATEINDLGVIVGFVPQAGVTQHAYRYDGLSAPQDLGVIGGTQSFAWDINNAGTVVGWSNINASTVKKAFKYTSSMAAIPGLSNFSDSEALSINSAGDVVGYMNGANGIGTPFRYTAAGSLLTLTGSTSGAAYDINDAGYVVGTISSVAGASLWSPSGTLVNLNQWLDTNDPVEGAKWTLTNGLGINNNGLIVGVGLYNPAGGGGGAQRAYLLDAAALVPEPSSAALAFLAAGLVLRRARK